MTEYSAIVHYAIDRVEKEKMMIIDSINLIRTRDVPRYAWSRIGQFQNIQHTSDLICQLHSISEADRDNRKNAKSQAEQIKYCLSQAQEYFDAATAVSLATRPVLLYYAVMSMALAEVLLKQTGDSRLSKLREQHNCHGLQLSVHTDPKPDERLAQSASTLVAKAQKDSLGSRRGTFEVWRTSAREYPAGGWHTINLPELGAEQRQYRTLLTPADEPPPPLPRSGITLLDCLSELPYMLELLRRLGVTGNVVHTKLHSQQTNLPSLPSIQLIVHPNPPGLIEKFGENIRVNPDAVNRLNIKELPSGYIMSYVADPGITMSFPNSICMDDESLYFSCSGLNLGEFGSLYVALHICGNFARYYPDIWLKHIERNSPLAMAIDELCAHAFERLPLLTLSELLRVYHVLQK
ncbi:MULTISPECIES: YaaC family protein [Paraburkholderia]|uniref:YaaC family protein n=1 Tax=Paraburkholderia TaxID=1822464 RepID=UPI00224D4073|nr:MULTISPECIES: YaaC family protein [Paraburkholderia]MCX4157017.1 YaaC family protein [Paraburkholderia aspalathi]MDN7166421.1 YaaC family protein [Paraburkholderia sp. SECH2]MDQ6394907.1 YaaC family protein [Paraburkholderia aspalathi]